MAKKAKAKSQPKSKNKPASTSTASQKTSEKSSDSKPAISAQAIADRLYKPITNNQGFIALEISPSELLQLTTLLKFSKDSFTKIASNAREKNDSIVFDAYASKARSADDLYSKFGSLAQIGEPNSRDIH